MQNQGYQLILSNFSVGTWLQTLFFYFILFMLFRIVLSQLNFSLTTGPVNFIQRWVGGRLQK